MIHQGDLETLKPGQMLNWYRIGEILGKGGFGVTYLALDTNLEHQFAIKEYFPKEISSRISDGSVAPTTEDTQPAFDTGLDRFINEARTLVKFKHPNIVRVASVFEANNTAYMVMEFEQGRTLREFLETPGNNSETSLRSLLSPVMDGLSLVHSRGFIHRDIKPANIYVREDNTPVLIDFGSARPTPESNGNAPTSMVSIGYAPLEQYGDTTDFQQGPWTDVYALGAVLYYAITKEAPVESTVRANAILNGQPDPQTPLSTSNNSGYSHHFLHSINWALNFKVADRPATLSEWRKFLFAEENSLELLSKESRTKQVSSNATTVVSLPTTEARLSTTNGNLHIPNDSKQMNSLSQNIPLKSNESRQVHNRKLRYLVAGICVVGAAIISFLLLNNESRINGYAVGSDQSSSNAAPVAPGTVSLALPLMLDGLKYINPVKLEPQVRVNDKVAKMSLNMSRTVWNGQIQIPTETAVNVSVTWMYENLPILILDSNYKATGPGNLLMVTADDYEPNSVNQFDHDEDGYANMVEFRDGFNPLDYGNPGAANIDVTIPWISPSEKPTIDGLWDQIWGSARFRDRLNNDLKIDNLIVDQGAMFQDQEADFQWAAFHDASTLYIMVFAEKVETATLQADSTEPFRDDALHIYIDADNSKGKSYDQSNDFHIVIPMLKLVSPADFASDHILPTDDYGDFIFNGDQQILTRGSDQYTDLADIEANENHTGDNRSRIFSGAHSTPVPDGIVFGNCKCDQGRHTYEIAIDMKKFGLKVDKPFGIEIQLDDDVDGGDLDATYAWKHSSRENGTNVNHTKSSPEYMGTAYIE